MQSNITIAFLASFYVRPCVHDEYRLKNLWTNNYSEPFSEGTLITILLSAVFHLYIHDSNVDLGSRCHECLCVCGGGRNRVRVRVRVRVR